MTTGALSPGILAMMLAGLGTLLPIGPPTRGDGARPNIVLIMADDMGYSDLGCYGGEIRTPNLDGLAKNGLRFSQFYNGARCCPTRASLLTGLSAHRAGVGGMVGGKGPGPYQGYLNDRCVTVAEVLGAAGYSTYMSGKWHVGEERPHWPVDRGFDRHYGLISGGMNYFNIEKGKSGRVIRHFAIDGKEHRPGGEGYYVTDAFSENAVTFIREHPDDSKPFFLYLAYTAPHWPLHAWPEDIARYRGKYMGGWAELRKARYRRLLDLGLIDRRWKLSEADAGVADWEAVEDRETMDLKMAVYAAQIDRMDQGIGRVIDALRARGVLENTIIMFLSDNGASAESGALGRNFRPDLTGPIGSENSYLSYGLSWANASNTPFRKFKQYTHEGGIATPFIVHWPRGISSPGRIVRAAGHITDVMATCCELAAAAYPQTFRGKAIEPLEGRSLRPLFDGKERAPRELYWEHFGRKAVRRGTWKLVGCRDEPWELFDLSVDRTERRNLAEEHPELAETLRRKYENWAARVGADTRNTAERIAALISRAGNADDDPTRLDLLKTLRDLPGIDGDLRADADRLVAAIDRYIKDPRLPYFGPTVHDHGDFDFGIAPTSPLHPITNIYRARMLLWVTLEYGGYWSNPTARRQQFDRIRPLLEKAREDFPENRLVRMYLGEPRPPAKKYTATPAAPEWAVHQREGLERLADVIEWWIDHRMQPGAEYGGGWGDDCEMWRWWIPVLIAFDDPKIRAAQTRFSSGLLAQEHMKLGYTSRIHDVEHTAEDSADVLTPMMHLDPDSETWRRRALRLAELMRTRWTGRNERGFLQFRSTYFSAEKVDPSPRRACDTVYHPRAVQPALLLWQRTADPALGKLFVDWMDTWVDAAARAERGKPAGVIPSAIHWPDGAIGGLGENWWDPENHTRDPLYVWPSAMGMMMNTLLLTFHMTGDSKYLEPLRAMAQIRLEYLAKPESDPEVGSASWCGSKLLGLSRVAAKHAFLTGRDDFQRLLCKDASPYVTFRRGGDLGPLVAALRDNAAALRVNFAGFTSEVRYTDRVLSFPYIFGANGMYPDAVPAIHTPRPHLLYSTTTGDPGGAGYFPINAVRWFTPPRDIAALVTDTGPDRFSARLFHFGEEERPMAAELHLLDPGDYVLTVKPHGTDSSTESREEWVTVSGPRTRVTFTLPPRTLCVVRAVRRAG